MISPVLPTYNRFDLQVDRGEGAYLFATDGSRYLDMGGGIAVNALGHAHPHLVKTLTEQAGKLWHTSNLYRIPDQERLAQRLTEVTFADTVFFCNSGAEAVEGSIKMARKFHHASGHPERYRLITFQGAFHGRTLATIAAGGQEKYLEGFGPKVDGFDQVPFGDLEAVKSAIGPETAGILVEPVQGEGGIRVIPNEILRALRQICDDNDLLLIFDEIQCGVGRTGKLFAHEWSGIAPDIMAIAKAIGGGFPLGAFLATEEAAKGMVAGTHGTTYGGNPLAMAVGNAVLDVVLTDGFMEGVQAKARDLRQGLSRVIDEHPSVLKGLRGEGLMIGLECTVLNTELVGALLEEHVLSVGAGDNVVRFLPALTMNKQELEEALVHLEAACVRLEQQMESQEA